MLLIPAAWAQSGPYVTLSSGTATFSAENNPSQTRRRDAIAVGYAANGVIAIEASYFGVQPAGYAAVDMTGPGFFNPNFYPVTSAMKLSGYAFGLVLRWKLSDRVTLFTKQSVTSIKAEESTRFNTGWTSNWNSTVRAYQPGVGIDFRLSQKTPLSFGLEVNRALISSYAVNGVTCVMVNFTYGL
jgi:hypothetical protein